MDTYVYRIKNRTAQWTTVSWTYRQLIALVSGLTWVVEADVSAKIDPGVIGPNIYICAIMGDTDGDSLCFGICRTDLGSQ